MNDSHAKLVWSSISAAAYSQCTLDSARREEEAARIGAKANRVERELEKFSRLNSAGLERSTWTGTILGAAGRILVAFLVLALLGSSFGLSFAFRHLSMSSATSGLLDVVSGFADASQAARGKSFDH